MFKFFALAAALQILWALTPSASKVVLLEIPVELFTAVRWTISGLIFLLVALALKKKIDLHPRMLFKYFLLGVVGYGFSSLGTLYGLKLGGVVNFSLLTAVNPLIVAFLSIKVLKEKVDRKYWIAVPLCVLGLVAMVAGKHNLSGANLAISSAALIIVSYFCEALPFIYSKMYRSKQSLIGYMAVLQLSAAAFMWVAEGVYFRQMDQLFLMSRQGVESLLFVSIVACGICYALLYWLLRFIDGHRLAIFDGIHVIFAAIFGLLFFNEPINFLMIVGGGFLLVALYLANAPSNENLPEKIAADTV